MKFFSNRKNKELNVHNVNEDTLGMFTPLESYFKINNKDFSMKSFEHGSMMGLFFSTPQYVEKDFRIITKK